MKTVVYTCITGGYDCLKEVPKEFLDDSLDFVCYTDDPNLTSKTWKIRMIPPQLKKLSDVKKQRIIKICPNKFFPEYEASLWIDGSMEIIGSILDLLNQCDLKKYPLWTLKHPSRTCIYEEEKAVLRIKKDVSSITTPQMARYQKEGYPKNYGLIESRILYRFHNNELCIKTMFLWANEILKGSHRDQLSFNYCCWKTGLKYGILCSSNVNKIFKWNSNHQKRKIDKRILKDENKDKIIDNIKTKEECKQLKVDSVDIYIVNFNRSELTNACIKSIMKNITNMNYNIFVLDNSDKLPFVLDNDIDKSLINIIDNTEDKVIPLKFAVKYFSYIHIKANENGSYKHALSIQWILDNCSNDNLLLFDCDTILKRNIDFLDMNYVTIAEIQNYPPKGSKTRFKPMLQYFNLALIKKYSLKYFYGDRIHGGMSLSGNYYDTGASFYEDIVKLKLPYKSINYSDYIEHFKSGTWKNFDLIQEFLSRNEKYWNTLNKFSSSSVTHFNYSNISKCKSKILDDPKTIQDKLAWLNIYDIPWSKKYDKPLKSICADKLLVKEYSKEKIEKDIGAKTLFVYNKSSEIDWSKLPNKFVLKVNHNSGGTIVCKDKTKLNIRECIAKIDKWMATDFTFQNGFESHYHWIERKIFVEELLEDPTQRDSLIDYKFWCFNGNPKFFTINSGHGHGAINHYDLNGNLLNLSRRDYPLDKSKKWSMPKNLLKMIEYAKKLSEDFKFVRVDFYEVNGEVYLGELTFTPGACMFKYSDENQDRLIGDMLVM